MVRKTFIVLFIISVIFSSGCTGNKSKVENDQTYISSTVSNVNDSNLTNENADDKGKDNDRVISEVTTPLLVKGYFMGGLSNGKWLKYDEFINQGIIKLDGFSYDVYRDDRKTCSAKGGNPTDNYSGDPLKGTKYEDGYDFVELKDANGKKIDYDIAIKADWNLFPRKSVNQNTEQKSYYDVVSAILEKEGLLNPQFKIKQIIRADLEGDGQEEVFISADNAVEGKLESTKKGDNAILIFRKIVNGKVVDQALQKNIYLKEPEYESPYRLLFNVFKIADLDGDGIMEVITRDWYYEGEEYCVWKLSGGKLEMVTGNGWGA